MNVGFIGLGNMGNPMAANILKAQYNLTVYDLRREMGQSLEAAGRNVGDKSEKRSRPIGRGAYFAARTQRGRSRCPR